MKGQNLFTQSLMQDWAFVGSFIAWTLSTFSVLYRPMGQVMMFQEPNLYLLGALNIAPFFGAGFYLRFRNKKAGFLVFTILTVLSLNVMAYYLYGVLADMTYMQAGMLLDLSMGPFYGLLSITVFLMTGLKAWRLFLWSEPVETMKEA